MVEWVGGEEWEWLFTKKGERKRLCTNELEKNDLEEVVKEIVLVIKEKKEG